MDSPLRSQSLRSDGERRNSVRGNVPRPMEMSGEGATYAEKASPTDSAAPIGSKPVFIRHRDIPNAENNTPTGEEIYVSLSKRIDTKLIVGVQKVRGLWRIYIESKEARVALISEGLVLRGAKTNVYDKNPYLNENEELMRLTIKDVPLSVNDELIVREIEGWKHTVRGKVIRQRLRVNGQLTSCLNGDRAIYIDPPRQPLPRHVSIASFKARIFHNGQVTEASLATCSRCLVTGHHASTCSKPFVCKNCRQPGHRAFECTAQNNRDGDNEGVTQSRQEESMPMPRESRPTPRFENTATANTDSEGSGRARHVTRKQATKPKSDVTSKRQQNIREMWSQTHAGSPKDRDDSESSSENDESDILSDQWSDAPGDTGRASCSNTCNQTKPEREPKRKRKRKGSNKKQEQ